MKKKTSNKPYEPMKTIDEKESYIPHTTITENSEK